MAAALDIDPLHLLRVVMEEYQPEVWKAIQSTLDGAAMSVAERELINVVRDAAGSTQIKVTPDEKKELTALVNAWKKQRLGCA